MVLSDALPEDNWTEKKDLDDPEGDGFVGFVHQVVIDDFYQHDAQRILNCYLRTSFDESGCIKMADDWGADENVRFDDFGG